MQTLTVKGCHPEQLVSGRHGMVARENLTGLLWIEPGQTTFAYGLALAMVVPTIKDRQM